MLVFVIFSILFANSRLGELSDTIGSLRYSSYEDGQEEMNKKYPRLADGGMHQLSSSDSDGGESGVVSSSSLSGDQGDDNVRNSSARRIFKSDSSKDETRKQIMLRDRLRISRPMFQKADFLGEDFSLLSAVDEADAYTAVGVELLHLLKYVVSQLISWPLIFICCCCTRVCLTLPASLSLYLLEVHQYHSSEKNMCQARSFAIK